MGSGEWADWGLLRSFLPRNDTEVAKTAKMSKSGRLNLTAKTGGLSFIKNMAEQTGTIKITGTIGEVCFYKLHGKHYARSKSSLTGKRVKTSDAFKNTMQYAALLAEASTIGSAVYRLLPKQKRERKVYQQLTGIAMQLLKKGTTKEDIIVLLKKEVSL